MPKDYKRAPRQPAATRSRRHAGPSRTLWFIAGLASGVLATVAVVWLEPSPEAVMSSIEKMRGSQPAEPGAAAKPPPRFEFYHLLPEMEVAVPEHELDAPPARAAPPVAVTPAAPDKPKGSGTYVIQVGSFQGVDDAERLRATLALQGFEAHVQSIAINGRDTWHRVRLGPFTSVADLNEVRGRLEKIDVSAMVLELKG